LFIDKSGQTCSLKASRHTVAQQEVEVQPAIKMEDAHNNPNNSSAYSSLTNSNGDVRSSENGDGYTYANNSAEEIRRITNDYNATLKKATAQIKSLSRERTQLEAEYEKQLSTNEELANILEKTIRSKRRLEEDHEQVLKSNDELFAEAQRLNDEESIWIEDKETLDSELKHLRSEVEDLRRNESQREAGELIADKTLRQIEEMKSEKLELTNTITQLEIEHKKLTKELQRVEKERDNILNRKEMVTGENMQLIVEAEEFHQVKADLTNQLRSAQNCIRDLEKENANLKFEFDSKMVDQQAERYASLVEKNKNLTDWREQLIEKNRLLTEENRKYAERCANLEELLNEEETDINVVLDMITKVQMTPNSTNIKNGNNGTMVPNNGPTNQLISSKMRDFK